VIPNGVDVDFFRPREEAQEGCVFVGGTNWFPNRDGLEWFHGAVLPELRLLGQHTSVTWVGRCTDDDRRRFGGAEGVAFTGYVPDVRPFLGGAACVIAPLRVGGGTRLKILDAWASGRAVVSTTQGCEGLRAISGANLIVADEPAGFAQAIQRVLDDPSLRDALGRAGRETAERHYSWTALGRELCRLYAEVTDATLPSRTRSA
jgi:glycosyltransferase involved in cell wall biosynthesis